MVKERVRESNESVLLAQLDDYYNDNDDNDNDRGAHGAMVIFVGNGYGDTSSTPGQD